MRIVTENSKERIKRIFAAGANLAVYYILVFALDLITRRFLGLGFGKFTLLVDLIFMAFFGALLFLFPVRLRAVLEFAFLTILSIYCFAQCLHYAYFSSLFTFRKLTLVGDFKDVFQEIFVKLGTKYLIFFAPLLLFAVFFVLTKQSRTKDNSLRLREKLVFCALLAVAGFLGQTIAYKEMLKSDAEKDWMGDKYLYDTFYNNLRFYDRFGLYEYVVRDAQFSSRNNSTVNLSNEDRETISQYINDHQNEPNARTGIYEGKNLVLVLCESLNDYPINEELLPTLYMMANEGMWFTNYYAPLYQSATNDSEFISLTSTIPSIDYGATSYTFQFNEYPFALANLFREKGYSANSYHSNISNMYNREPLHTSLGFETFYSQDRLCLSNNEESYFQIGYNWINDDLLFDSAIRNTPQNKPFFDFVITASGHLPYVRDREEVEIQLRTLEQTEYAQLDEETKCYLAAQMNFDHGLAQLLDSLKDIGQLENTIIILYGDHYPYGISTKECYDEVVKETDFNMHRATFIIYDPSSSAGEKNEKLASTFDIYPTICNLFALDSDGVFQVGRDLNGNREGFVPFMNRSILTDTFYFDSSSGELMPFAEQLDEHEALKTVNEAQNIYDLGQKILTSNYYAKNE